MKYAVIKQRLINELVRSSDAQEAGQIWQIDGSYDQLEGEILTGNPDPEFDKLKIALEFWAGWLDARNHDWRYYEGIHASDWPKLAKLIADDLRADRETVDERITRHFDYRCREERPGIGKRLARLLTGRGSKP
jgi:hypothetical protein